MVEYRIKEILKEKHKTQRDLAKHFDTTPQHIYAILHGVQGMSMKKLEQIAEFLGVEVWELFKRSKPVDEDKVFIIRYKDGSVVTKSIPKAKEVIRNIQNATEKK